MRLGSLFDGIGGALLCARLSGIEPVWASEIEAFPIKVTQHHFPEVKHYGDITQMNGAKIEPVDIIVGGSPCQDLSVAGKRAGLEGERSGLFMDMIRIIKEMREATNNEQPRYMVWENVPGAFSSNNGEDFRAVLEETARVADPTISIPRSVNGWANAGSILADRFSISWRTFDAQYWGVPQRRKRIYLVADFRGQTAPEILFEQTSERRDIAQSQAERQRAAEDVERSVGEAVYVLNDQGGSVMTTSVNIVGTLRAQEHGHQPIVRVGEADTSRTIDVSGGNQVNAVCSSSLNSSVFREGSFGSYVEGEFGTLKKSGGALSGGSESFICQTTKEKTLRRLTPLECERLQGYPDGWTDMGSDTARYKALGNSFAIPCALFVIRGIYEKVQKQADHA